MPRPRKRRKAVANAKRIEEERGANGDRDGVVSSSVGRSHGFSRFEGQHAVQYELGSVCASGKHKQHGFGRP